MLTTAVVQTAIWKLFTPVVLTRMPQLPVTFLTAD